MKKEMNKFIYIEYKILSSSLLPGGSVSITAVRDPPPKLSYNTIEK